MSIHLFFVQIRLAEIVSLYSYIYIIINNDRIQKYSEICERWILLLIKVLPYFIVIGIFLYIRMPLNSTECFLIISFVLFYQLYGNKLVFSFYIRNFVVYIYNFVNLDFRPMSRIEITFF